MPRCDSTIIKIQWTNTSDCLISDLSQLWGKEGTEVGWERLKGWGYWSPTSQRWSPSIRGTWRLVLLNLFKMAQTQAQHLHSLHGLQVYSFQHCCCDKSCFPENSFIEASAYIVNSQNFILAMVRRVNRATTVKFLQNWLHNVKIPGCICSQKPTELTEFK